MIDTKAVRAAADRAEKWSKSPAGLRNTPQEYALFDSAKSLRQCAKEIDAKDAIINSQREALEHTWFVLKDFGAHPGRTYDLLHDCVRRAIDRTRKGTT